MELPAELADVMTAAGYKHHARVLWFQPIHPCSSCKANVPIWADTCYFCNGDDPTCAHDSEATPRFTWSAQDGKTYTVCLNCFDYIYD